MYAEERQQHILDRARAAGRVDVNALAEVLDVTPETVRRDQTILERYGVLRRVHGGATSAMRLAERVPRDHELTIFTNSLGIATLVDQFPHVSLYLLGGRGGAVQP